MAGKLSMPFNIRNWRMRKGVYRHGMVDKYPSRGIERRNE
jgi:hypothetical protein